MLDDYRATIDSAIKQAQKEGSGAWVAVYHTRDFWDDWEPEDMEAAFEEAEAKRIEARNILQDMLGAEPVTVQRKSDKSYRWLPAEKADAWDITNLRLLLFCHHEDKECPVAVCLYAYDPYGPGHRLAESDQEDRERSRVWHESTDDEKNALLDSPDTSPWARSTIYQFCRSYPRRAILDGIRRNLHREFEGETPESMTTELARVEEDLAQFGEAYPISEKDFDRLERMGEKEVIELIDAESTGVAMRTRALTMAYKWPTDRMIQALNRNKHRDYDKRWISDVGLLIESLRESRNSPPYFHSAPDDSGSQRFLPESW